MRRSAVFLGLMFVSTPALADWNGTWAGNWNGPEKDGVQIILAGDDVIGIYWHGDYISEDMASRVSPDGKVLTITWADGGATLTRENDSKAKFQIHDASGSADGEVMLDR